MRTDYPDVETAVLDWLDGQGLGTSDTVTPPDLQDRLPFIRVSLVTGSDDQVTDSSVVDIDVFAESRLTAYACSEAIRTRFSGQSHRVGTVVLDRVRTEEKPRRLPSADDNIVRFGATYRISARR